MVNWINLKFCKLNKLGLCRLFKHNQGHFKNYQKALILEFNTSLLLLDNLSELNTNTQIQKI